MKKTLSYFIYSIVLIVCVLTAYTYRVRISDFVQTYIISAIRPIPPCSQPITYRIGSVDSRFGLSKDALLADIRIAATYWNNTRPTPLLIYAATGTIAINLIYDYRQGSTDKLKKLGIVIDNGRASYDTLKKRYDSLKADYITEKQTYDAAVATFKQEQAAYQKESEYWNSRGGAPPKEYARLSAERTALLEKARQISTREDSINVKVDNLNSTVTVLNSLAHELNLTVETFNGIGATTGKEFDEGEYIQTATSTAINIYQYNSRTARLRVLEHELGHAIGLNHVANPRAIMYHLNQGTDLTLTPDDIAELSLICHSTSK